MTITPSRLLTRLDTDIAAAADLVTADCLRAERAAYLARQGHLAEATKELEAIRQRHSRNPTAAVSAWVSLAEGILAYFTLETSPLARDKLHRAYALSSATNLTSITVTSLAWLAQLEYANLNFELLAKYARIGLELVTHENRSATSRLSLVIGQAYHLAGSIDQAEPWYKTTRQIASADGDEPTIVALSHNMAWLLMSELRRSVLTKNESKALLNGAIVGGESYLSANVLMQDTARSDLVPTLRAQLLSLSGRVREAIEVYQSWFETPGQMVLGRFGANTKADLAWCYARVGEIPQALELASNLVQDISQGIQIDELAATYNLLQFVYEAADNYSEATRFALLSKEAWGRFREIQDDIKLHLDSLSIPR